MNKKLLLVSILAVFTLVAISFATVVSSNTTTTVKKKESPLFGIRTRLAIGERLHDLKETIKAQFVGERVFFLQLQDPNWRSYSPAFYTKGNTCHDKSLPCTEGCILNFK
jgi:hypothetical protein